MRRPSTITRAVPLLATPIAGLCFAQAELFSPPGRDVEHIPLEAAQNARSRPSARELLEGAAARLPRGAFTISGSLVTRRPGENHARQTLGLEASFSFDEDRFLAVYRIADAFGDERERLIALRGNQQPPTFDHQRRGASAPEPLSDPLRPVEGTALTWLDLTLSFLWWTEGVTIGRQEVKQQPCWVLDIWPPKDAGAYARMRLWLDTRVGMLLQAEGYDRQGALVRRLSVKSFKKIGDDWMIKDMEARDVASGLVTVLRVRDMARDGVPTEPRSVEAETPP